MAFAPVHVIGGGLAGCEAAFQLARAGIPVRLYEMRPEHGTEAHRTGRLAELVCSNSFRSDDPENNAVGLLHAEMRRLGSLVMTMADRHRLPAGTALAVDRDGFSAGVEAVILEHPLIELCRQRVDRLPDPAAGDVIVATGPLTANLLAEDVRRLGGESELAFFDAIAPIVHKDSIDMDVAWLQSRWDRGAPGDESSADYINCPLDKVQYQLFLEALLTAATVEFREWERTTPYFEACLPVEVMAARGPQTLRFGPMKPVGLVDPRSARRPWAVVQLRQDNALGTLWNMVGFQTKLRHAEQMRVLRMIPGLERAEFARLGGLHRNTFINGPKLLLPDLRFRAAPHIRFAGQITGVEGYVESSAMGLVAGRLVAAARHGRAVQPPPPETAHGSLLAHVTGGADARYFQPMNVNFGLFPPLLADVPRDRRRPTLAARAMAALERWLADDTVSPSFSCQEAQIG